MDNYGFVEIDGDDAYDPMARIPANETLAETLLLQLEALIPPDDAPIAEQLVGSLNERGYLEANIQEIAGQLDVPPERVEYVLKQLQTLEPLGIDLIGLNCATGPDEMGEHLRYLAAHSRVPVSCMPNAGLPQLTSDGAYYPVTP